MADGRAIGVFDSGLGGLTVMRELIKQMPYENIVYFGDTGRVPYGTRSRETIKKYAAQDERFLLENDVKLIIAACGTVSSVAAKGSDNLPVPFFEMVTHAARAAVKATKNSKIGVIGTPATIASESHKREILQLMPTAEITASSCPLFVPLVEEGWFDENDTVVKETVRRYLQPIIDSKADTLILGCTHYPVLERAIASVMGDKVTLINPGIAVAAAVDEYLTANSEKKLDGKNGVYSFFVSDKPDSFKSSASLLLGEEVDEKNVNQIDIEAF